MFPRHFVALSLSFAALVAATPALAHAQLQQAVPAVGGTVSASPQDLRLHFSEGVEPRFSTVALASAAGGAIPLGRPAVDPADPATLVVKVGKTLQPGTYAVTWHVVSVDTHKTQGSFDFTVSP
jgi:methionine-rich copper-binding protein CopC